MTIMPIKFNNRLGLNLLENCDLQYYDGTFDFQFSDLTIKVPLNELIVGDYLFNGEPATYENGSPVCFLSIFESGAVGNDIILGDSFLRSAYVVYDLDNGQIAMAQTKFNVTDSSVEDIDSEIPNATAVTPVTPSSSAVPGVNVRTGILSQGNRVTASYSAFFTSPTSTPSPTSSGSNDQEDESPATKNRPSILVYSLVSLAWATIGSLGFV